MKTYTVFAIVDARPMLLTPTGDAPRVKASTLPAAFRRAAALVKAKSRRGSKRYVITLQEL
ncbi:MAG: hypothetical protein M0R37_12055 [Bacteroidales bacterium]|jgi:hypothetical protein|nr:hypothetical protein [Sphaerochaeta sp.]MCK9629308.1 hypothetical protein [Bacteroidales bacterium]